VRRFNEYFPPYKSGRCRCAGLVMASFNEIDGIPWAATEINVVDD
jgi:beta-glucosidase